MPYLPGDAYYRLFTTTDPNSRATTDADAPPVAVATRNDVDDPSFVLTVTRLGLGRYGVAGTIPATYHAGDDVEISVTATVAGITGTDVIGSFQVGPPPGSGVEDPWTMPLPGAYPPGSAGHILASGLDIPVSARPTVALAEGVVAASPAPTTATIVLTGVGTAATPADGAWKGQEAFRPATGERRVIAAHAVSGTGTAALHTLRFAAGTGRTGSFASAPQPGETINIG